MKVCHVITRMIVGGAQENTLLSAKGFAESKLGECVLLTGHSPGPEGELLARTGIPDGVRVEVCPALVRNISPLNDLRAPDAISMRLAPANDVAPSTASVPLETMSEPVIVCTRFKNVWVKDASTGFQTTVSSSASIAYVYALPVPASVSVAAAPVVFMIPRLGYSAVLDILSNF